MGGRADNNLRFSHQKSAYNRSVPVFMCRWPNGDLSFVAAASKDDAIVMLDELDNAELAELKQVQDFMIDFRLTDTGELEFQGFGERSTGEHLGNGPTRFSFSSGAERYHECIGENRFSAWRGVDPESCCSRAAAAERQEEAESLRTAKREKLCSSQMGAPTVLVNRLVKQAATEVLKRSPNSGRKQ